MWFKPAKNMLIQQVKRGELTIFIIAIILAVSSVFSLSGFGDRLNQAIVQKSSDFLAADRVLSSAHPLPQQLLTKADQYGLNQAHFLGFNSVIFNDEEMALTNTKAISGPYPLRGQLKISKQPLTNLPLEDQGKITYGPPSQGNVWVAPEVLVKLNVTLGSKVAIGEADFIISGIITFEPDVSVNIFNLAPRVILNLADIPATEIAQPGSRLAYSYLFSGTTEQLQAYYRAIKPSLRNNQIWQNINNERSPLAQALEHANRFLMLASLLGIILAATAISVTTSSYSERQLDTVALLKTFGTPNRLIIKIFSFQLTVIMCASIFLGLLAGYLLQESAFTLIAYYLPQSLPEQLPPIGANSVIISILTGLICTVMFSVTPLLKLLKVPVIRVIKRDLVNTTIYRWLSSVMVIIAIFSLLLLYSRDLTLSLIILSATILVGLVLSALAALFIKILHQRRFSAASAWQLAIASLQQRVTQASSQIASIATAIMLMLIIILLNNELVDEWRQQLPQDGANHFLANITPEQIAPINKLMLKYQVNSSDLYPTIRGRVAAINDEKIAEHDSETSDEGSGENEHHKSGRKGFGRELNLTWRTERPLNNPIVEGQWWQGNETEHLVSIEQGVAERLDIRIDDQLTVLVGQTEISVRVSSIRKVNWRSLTPNFFLIFNRAALGDVPSTYISSFYLPSVQHPLLDELLRSYPTLSIIKIDRIIKKLRAIIEQVSFALLYIMLLVVGACLLVLLVQIQASYQQRHHDLVILRTLGASRRLLKRAIGLEFLIMGALAGFIASLATEIALWLIQTYVIEMTWQPHLYLWLLATLGGSIFVGLVGSRACRKLTELPPSELIRNLS